MQLLNAARPEPACRVQSGGPHTVTGGRRGLLLLCLCAHCSAELLLIRIYAWSAILWAVGRSMGPWSQFVTSGGDCIAHSARRTPRSIRYAHCLRDSYWNSPCSSIPVFYGNWPLPFWEIPEWTKAANP